MWRGIEPDMHNRAVETTRLCDFQCRPVYSVGEYRHSGASYKFIKQEYKGIPHLEVDKVYFKILCNPRWCNG